MANILLFIISFFQLILDFKVYSKLQLLLIFCQNFRGLYLQAFKNLCAILKTTAATTSA